MEKQDGLIRAIKAKQEEEGLTLTAMAEKLGVSISMLSLVYSGKRAPGNQFLNGVIEVYPELMNEVALFLLRDIASGKAQLLAVQPRVDIELTTVSAEEEHGQLDQS